MRTIIRLKRLCGEREAEICKRLDLTPAEYHCLMVFPRHERMGAGALASLMGLSASRFSRVMARMERGGLLQRFSVRGDGRVVEVELSDRGRLLKTEVGRAIDACEDRLLAQLPTSDVEAIRTALTALADTMSAFSTNESGAPARAHEDL